MPAATKLTKTWIFYLSSFISYLYNGIIGPLFIIYLLAINISPAQIGIVLFVQRVSIIIFEAPTGIFADKYGRKKSVLISFFLFSVLFLIWFFAKNFYLLLLISIIGGFAYTFQSGAKESLLIDNLGLKDDDKKRNKIFARLSMIGHIGFFLGGLIAAGLAFYSIKFIWLAASLFNLMLFSLFSIFIHDDFKTSFVREKNKLKNFFQSAKNDFKFIIHNNAVSLLIAISFIFAFLTAVYGLAYPILFKQTIGLPDYYFGFLGTLSALMGVIGVFLAEKLTSKKNYFFTFTLFSLTLFALFFFFGFKVLFLWSLIVFALIELIINGWHPIYQSLFNKFIPNKNRASILSISSTFILLSIALGEISAGLLLNFIQPNNLLIISSLPLLAIAVLIIKLRQVNKKCPE